jgi:hypothetical protein
MSVPVQRVTLLFDRETDGPSDLDQLLAGLSAVERTGDYLWLACDEAPALERLVLRGDGTFGGHETFALEEYVDLPAEGEVDVEGLAYMAPYLWVVGSHSRKRKKADPDEDDAACIKRIAEVSTDESREFLARIPLHHDPERGLVPVRQCDDPMVPGTRLTAARLRAQGRKGSILRALEGDEHLGEFLRVPGKDNGFDIEGLAVLGDRVFVGLRGPVLRGWAVVLEIEPVLDDDHPHRLRLRRIGDDGERYRKHFIDLEGMGIRDLRRDGDDLLLLAGATMALSAPAAVWRWPGGAHPDRASLVRGHELRRILDFPYHVGKRDDNPEALALFDRDPVTRVMVLYDSAAEDRCLERGVLADVFELRETAHEEPGSEHPRTD